MANFYIVAGGTGSNKHLIGLAISRKHGIPLLHGEDFYTDQQLDLACEGQPFDAAESLAWAQATQVAMLASGGCVLVSKHVSGDEMPVWESCGRIFMIDADPTAEELMATWTTEHTTPHLAMGPGRGGLNSTVNIHDNLIHLQHGYDLAERKRLETSLHGKGKGSFYIVTGGVGSSKILLGHAYARKNGIPVLFGESYYNDAQFEMACAGTPFDPLESSLWAHAVKRAMAVTGGCVLICRHISHSELDAWRVCGKIYAIDTDPSLEEFNARRTAEENHPHVTHSSKIPNYTRPESLEEDIVRRNNAREAAYDHAVREYYKAEYIWGREMEYMGRMEPFRMVHPMREED